MTWPPLTHQDVQDAIEALQTWGALVVPRADAALTGAVTLNGERLGVLLTGQIGRGPYPEQPLDPVVGDWGWCEQSAAWFGPAYAVSWQVGDNVGVVPFVEGAGTGAVQPSVLVGAGPFDSDQPAPGIPQFDWGSMAGLVTTATAAGSGVIFLIQEEEGFGGPTTPGRPDLNVLDYLGDLVLTNGTTPIPWAPNRGDGYNGDYYLDANHKALYGPKTDGFWPGPYVLNDPTGSINVSAQSDVPVVTGYGFPGGTADLLSIYGAGTSGQVVSAFRVTAAGQIVAAAGYATGNSEPASTLGTVVGRTEVFDKDGTSLGFIPIYDTIT